MSFKIFKNNCCDLGVHKTWIYACIGITDSNKRTEYKQSRFSSFIPSADIRELRVLVRYRFKLTSMISTSSVPIALS
ncbi:MAG: hypothetical protein LUH14_07530 [Clostridiaceae bacterium]|nr:hypothetical protein [Clostridiaceae bacterium]